MFSYFLKDLFTGCRILFDYYFLLIFRRCWLTLWVFCFWEGLLSLIFMLCSLFVFFFFLPLQIFSDWCGVIWRWLSGVVSSRLLLWVLFTRRLYGLRVSSLLSWWICCRGHGVCQSPAAHSPGRKITWGQDLSLPQLYWNPIPKAKSKGKNKQNTGKEKCN